MRGSIQHSEIFGLDTLEQQVEKMVEVGAVFDDRVAKIVILKNIASERLMEQYDADPDSVDRFYRVNAEQIMDGRVRSITFEDEDVEEYLDGAHLRLWKEVI